MTFEVSKLETPKAPTLVHSSNRLLISTTLEVIKLVTSIVPRVEHDLNIDDIFLTLEVLNCGDILKSLKILIPSNILAVSVTLLVSKVDIFKSHMFFVPLNIELVFKTLFVLNKVRFKEPKTLHSSNI